MINGACYLDLGNKSMFAYRMTRLRKNLGSNQTGLWIESSNLTFEPAMMNWASRVPWRLRRTE